jgi:DNA-binding winged helix-turn-helix (wHTH) protein/Flp pilus assembly protein TadD
MASFEWDGWTFDSLEWRLTSDAGGVVSLPNKSLELLALLLDRAPSLVSKDEILSAVWRGTIVEEGNIAFHVAMLRRTLDSLEGASCIETVRARGYRFIAPVTRPVAAVDAPLLAPAPPALDSPHPAPAPPALDPPLPAPAPPALIETEDTTTGSPPLPVPVLAPRWRPVPVLAVVLLAAGAIVLAWVTLVLRPGPIREVAVLPVVSAEDTQPMPGAAEAIATGLGRLTSLQPRVVAGGEPSESLVNAGRRAGADSVLRTTVDCSATPWRVTVELARSRDGVRIWNWTFDVPAEPTAVPAVLSARIAAGLGQHLAVEAVPRDSASAETMRLTLRAREAWRRRTPASVQEAITLYERVIAVNPSAASAYAGLADCYNLTMSGLPIDVRAKRALANAERALAIDPGLAEAHTSLAFARYKFEWNWKAAEAGFRRAIAAEPSYALAHHWFGEMLGFLGRDDEAIAELRQAVELEPNALAILADLVPPLLHAGRIAEARAVVEKGAAIDPTFHWIPRHMAAVLAAEGRERESLEEEWRARVLTGATLESIEALRAAYRTGGRAAVLRLEIAWLETGGDKPFGVPQQATSLASRYARLGDRAKAFHWIGVALDRREDIALHLLTYPEYDALRADPRFTRQLARAGLVPLDR